LNLFLVCNNPVTNDVLPEPALPIKEQAKDLLRCDNKGISSK
jgi:hypothetical protein